MCMLEPSTMWVLGIQATKPVQLFYLCLFETGSHMPGTHYLDQANLELREICSDG